MNERALRRPLSNNAYSEKTTNRINAPIKDGNFPGGDWKPATVVPAQKLAEQFGQLQRHTRLCLQKICREMFLNS